jgi:hypothetical protein
MRKEPSSRLHGRPNTSLVTLGVFAASMIPACAWFCPDPRCPEPPNSEAFVPEAKHRVTVPALDDAGLDKTVCLVLSDDGPACQAAETPPVCDRRNAEQVRSALRPAFDALRGFKLLSATTAVKEIRDKLPAGGQPLVTTAVRDARRLKDCSSRQGGACVAVRWAEIWLLLHADDAGAISSVDIFPNRPLCTADIDR